VTSSDLTKLGGALLLGAALALPAGVLLGRLGGDDPPSPPAPRGEATARNMFSPSVRTDPYFLESQRKGVEALERYCARTGESCAEARAARRRLDELQAAN
jgi:hypothetical protein